MGVESSAVTITVQVVDANSGAELQRIVQGFQGVKTAAGGAEKAVRDTAAAIPGMRWSMRQVGQAVGETEGHFATSLDKVRLIRQEFGLFMPRAMESMIARSQSLMTIIGGMSSAVIGVGVAMVAWSGIREIIHGVQELNDNFLSLNGAAEQFNQELAKAREQDFGNVRSVEDLRARIDEATRSAQGFAAAQQALQQGTRPTSMSFAAWLTNPEAALGFALSSRYAAHVASQGEATAHKQLQTLSPHAVEEAHQRNLEQIQFNHALDDELRGRAKIVAQQQKQRELNAEERRYKTQLDSAYGNPVSPESGKSEMDLKNATAERQAQAQTYNLQREQAIEIRHLREQAAEAGLRGEALYHRQEAAAIADLRDKDMDSMAARSAVHAKFHAEELKRLQEEDDQAEKMLREAQTAGLTGLARSQAEGANRVADIAANRDLSPAARSKEIRAAQMQTQAQLVAEQQSFANRIDEIADASAGHQISGFARIRANAQRQLDQLQHDFERTYGQIDITKPGGLEAYAQGAAQLDRGRGAILGGAGQQTADLARRNAQETEEIEAQARIKSLSADKQQTAQIELEYEDRLRKLQESLQQQEISWDDYNRRVAAAGMERDAQMAESAREARRKIAGEMRGLFTAHPLQALQQMGSKYAAEAGASILQRIGGHFGGHAGSPDGILARIAGAPHAGFGSGHGLTTTGMSIATAEIHVGSAAIFAAGGSGAAGGWTGRISPSIGGGTGFAGTAPPGPTIAPGGGMSVSGLANMAQRGIGTARGVAGLFRGNNLAKAGNSLETTDTMPNGHLNADGTFTSAGSSGWNRSMLGGGMTMSNTLGAAGAGLGLFSAWKQGGVGGMMSGTMSGAQLGMEVGGPVGAAVGAAVGFAMGFFGGSEQARVYDLKQVRPRIANDAQGFNNGSMDYMSAYNDLESLMTEAKNTTNKMGFAGQRYYQSTIKGELNRAMSNLSREQKAGRSMYGFSAAQFAVGTDYFPRDAMAYLHEGERILPSDQNERITRAIENQSMMPVQPSAAWGGDLHVHAIDGKSALQFLMANKHNVRAAMNASFAENSGGADAGY